MSRGLGVYVGSLRVFSRGGEPIVRDASFQLEEGDLALVVGRSGSGKTTILRVLAGVAQGVFGLRVEGSVKLFGESVSRSSVARYVSYVPQEPWSAVASPYPVIELTSFTRASRAEVEEALHRLGLEHILEENTSSLSPGEIQRLLIAEAYLARSRLVLVDEALSYLDPASRAAVIEMLRELAEGGSIVIVVDHVAEQWRGLYTKVIYVESGAARAVDSLEDTGYLQALERCLASFEALRPRGGGGEAVAEVRDLWFRYPDARDYVLRGVWLRAREGSIVVVKGGSGRGKSTLLRVVAGLYRASRGRVVVRARPQLVPENPLLYISSPTPREELGDVASVAEEAGLAHRLDTPIAFLSGGERRRLAIASAYVRSPRLLLVDEPSVGLDPWSALSVARLLSTLASRGSAIVIATHDPYLARLGNEVLEV